MAAPNPSWGAPRIHGELLRLGFEVSRRQVVHFNVTANQSGQWTAQQDVETFTWETAPKYLLRDRDSTYVVLFRNRVNSTGIKEVISAPQNPWQNPFVDRMTGSISRECQTISSSSTKRT